MRLYEINEGCRAYKAELKKDNRTKHGDAAIKAIAVVCNVSEDIAEDAIATHRPEGLPFDANTLFRVLQDLGYNYDFNNPDHYCQKMAKIKETEKTEYLEFADVINYPEVFANELNYQNQIWCLVDSHNPNTPEGRKMIAIRNGKIVGTTLESNIKYYEQCIVNHIIDVFANEDPKWEDDDSRIGDVKSTINNFDQFIKDYTTFYNNRVAAEYEIGKLYGSIEKEMIEIMKAYMPALVKYKKIVDYIPTERRFVDIGTDIAFEISRDDDWNLFINEVK